MACCVVLVPTAWGLLAAVTLAIFILDARFSDPFRPLLHAMLVATALCVGIVHLLALRGQTRLAITVLLGVLFCIPVAYSVRSDLGVNSSLLSLYPVLVIVAAVLLDAIVALLCAIAVAAVAALYLAETAGLLPGAAVMHPVPPIARATTYILTTAIGLLSASCWPRCHAPRSRRGASKPCACNTLPASPQIGTGNRTPSSASRVPVYPKVQNRRSPASPSPGTM